jgi:hypothetical protein
MENIRIQCRSCGRELNSISGKSVSCGCPNMASIRNGVVSAVDLSKIVMINSLKKDSKNGVLTTDDIMWQEARRQRKVKKLNFEVR